MLHSLVAALRPHMLRLVSLLVRPLLPAGKRSRRQAAMLFPDLQTRLQQAQQREAARQDMRAVYRALMMAEGAHPCLVLLSTRSADHPSGTASPAGR